MEAAILAVSALAALAAVAAVLVPVWQQRPKLALFFTGAWDAKADRVMFVVRVENLGKAPIYGIRVSRFGPGDTQRTGHLKHLPVLQAGTWTEIQVPFERPQRVDVLDGEIRPTFAVPLTVWAEYGRHRKQLAQPVGPFAYL